MQVPNRVLTVSKSEAATRQVAAAIEALVRGDFDIAITLAGAAEGMFERTGMHLFAFLRDHSKVKGVPQKEWIDHLNREHYWLKHHSGPDSLQIERADAVFMIVRAASKLEEWPPLFDEFKAWLVENLDAVTLRGAVPQP